MVIYESAIDYIGVATNARERIVRIDAIIFALENSAIKAAATGEITEYSLDDGQTKISQVYRNPLEIERSITAFERIRQMLINRITGRMTRLSDESNFRQRFQ
jgi:hypothetical protein